MHVEELRAWAARSDAEAALAGTAAILAGVGTLIIEGRTVRVGSGDVGAATTRLRRLLQQIHWGSPRTVMGG